MNTILLILVYGIIHAFAAWLMEHTYQGKRFKTFLQTWRTDSVWELLSYSGIVFIWGVAAILAVGLTFKALGI